jgi:type III secretory pathway component EscS
MNLKDLKEKLFSVIKVISIVAIASAIGLELWHIQALTSNNHLPIILNRVLIIAHFALSAHFIEGIIAAFYAPGKNYQPIKYGIYTFFVGTIGLLELFSADPRLLEEVGDLKL